VTISPDTKDWTWVLRRPCPECGYDSRDFPRTRTGALLRSNATSWREVLAAPDVRERPRPDVWSPLEYACHVRDVHRLYAYRLGLMLTQDGPRFENWDQDATAVAEDYGSRDPAAVVDELVAAAEALAAAFDAVEGDQWTRTGDRSDGAHFTVESFARYLVHDPIHHLYDVTRSAA
jgi:hypothetical protein